MGETRSRDVVIRVVADAARRARDAVFALILATLAVPLAAQQLPLVTYLPDDGLSHSQVWTIFQDSRGYIWVGTSDGLNRFDSVSFSSFRVRDGLKNPTIRTIVEDEGGHLWFGTDNGVGTFDGLGFKWFGETEGLGKGTVWCSTRDRYGRIWFGTQYAGASMLDGGRFKSFAKAEGLGHEYVYSILADSKGNLWFGHRGGGVTRCEADKNEGLTNCRIFTKKDGLPHDDVRAIIETKDDGVYLGTRGGGIARWDGTGFTTYTTKNGFAENDVYAMLVNHRGDIVIGTLKSGISICRPDFSSCRSYSMSNGLPDNAILGMYEDRDHALWVGFQVGLSRIASDRMLSYTMRNGLPHSTVYAVHADVDGTVWIGTLGGLVRVRKAPSPFEQPKLDVFIDALPGAQVWDLHRDHRGRLWVATEGGLCQFDGTRCTRVITKDQGLLTNDLITLGEARDGRLLVTSAEGVSIVRLDPTLSIENYTLKEGLAGNYVFAILEDETGRIWAGSDQGLSSIEKGKVRAYTTKDGLSNNEVYALTQTHDGAIWVGTNGGGVIRFRPPPRGSDAAPRFKAFGPESGVPDSIAAFEFDRHGRLWLGATDGVVLFDPEKAGKSESIIVRIDKQTGLAANETNAFATDPEGGLWIGVAGGVTRYDQDLAEDPPPPPLVTIESLRTPGTFWRAPFTQIVEGQKAAGWLGAGLLTLPPRPPSIRIDYRGLSFRERARVRYQVMLEGFDADWSEPTAETFKEYTNLDPRKYRFVVRASTRPNVWGTPTELQLEIRPAWWETRLFAAASTLLAILLIVGGVRARVYQINRRNRELEVAVDERTDDLRRYARALEEHSRALDRANARIREADRVKSEFLANMSHELRTPLNSIIGFSDVLVPSLQEKIGSRESRFLSNIQTSGRYLLLLINNLLDLSKIEAGRAEVFPERVNASELVENTCEIVQGYARDRNIEVVARVPGAMPDVMVDVPKFKQIILNLLSNAVKFSKSGDQVRVEVRTLAADASPLGTDAFELAVFDQGPGIRPEDHDVIFKEFTQVGGGSAHPGGTGLGLALVKRFVSLMGGRIDLESEPGKGSTFRVILPNEVRESTEWRATGPKDTIQPRILLLDLERGHAQKLPITLDDEGFAPVRVKGIEEAVPVQRDIAAAAAILGLSLTPPEGWSLFASMRDRVTLADLTLGTCVAVKGKPVFAIGIDAFVTQPLVPDSLAAILDTFVSRGDTQLGPVLVIDNDHDRTHTIESVLSGHGYSTRVAAGAAEAVDLAIASEPAAIVVNLVMPALAGLDAIQRMQHDRRTRHTPIIAIAPGRDLTREEAAMMLEGYAAEEPASFDELALTMHELLRRRSARAVRMAAASLAYAKEA